MKTKDEVGAAMDPTRVALLLGVTIGLGIVVHEGFFLVAGAIAVGAAGAAVAHALQSHIGLRPQRH